MIQIREVDILEELYRKICNYLPENKGRDYLGFKQNYVTDQSSSFC